MKKHDETLARTKQTQAGPLTQVTPWGFRRKLAATEAFEVHVEVIGAGANLGVRRAEVGQLTVFVLSGVLWVKDLTSGKIGRLGPGHSFTSAAGRAFQLGTGQKETSLLEVQPAGFDLVLERLTGTANQLERKPSALPAGPSRRPQRSFEERALEAKAAQGLGREQALPGQPRSAADVSGSFNVPGVNLAPVVPEP